LNRFPVMALLKLNRRRLGKKTKVIYHCRGTSAAEWAVKLSAYFPGDKVILDVRGYWPAELLYNRGIEYPEQATGVNRVLYEEAREALKNIIGKADGLSTISSAMLQLLSKEADMPRAVAVVPCCVSSLTGDERRQE